MKDLKTLAKKKGLIYLKDSDGSKKLCKFIECGHEIELHLSSPGKSKCSICYESELRKIAASRGLEYLGHGNKNKKHTLRRYKFKKCGHEIERPQNEIKKSKPYCTICFEKKLEDEAKKAGLKIIKNGKSSDFRLYQFLECNHQKEISTSNVRNKNFKCDSCFENKHNNEAQNYGLKIVGKGKDKNSRMYEFLDCGHQQSIQLSKVRRGVLECKTCQLEQFKVDAVKVGLTLKEQGDTRGYYIYECNKCFNKQQISTGHVRNKEFKCQSCFEKDRKQEAMKLGLIWIRDVETGIGEFKFDSCGHIKTMRWWDIRQSVIICNECEETSYALPSYVYLLLISVDGLEFLKFGYSKNIKHRVRQYRLVDGSSWKEIKKVKFKTGLEAKRFESNIHKRYSKKKLNQKRMKEIFMLSGWNECYPLDMRDVLLKELANLGNK